MSLALIEPQIKHFLSTEDAEVIVLKGKWGVGKTYLWEQIIKSEKKNINLKKYSYVSLFGINSLDTLKYSIFEQQIKCDSIGSKVNLETFKSNVEIIFDHIWKKIFGKAISLESPDFKDVFKDIVFLSINKIIICIDDLERKGKDLSIKDIMGLISVLKEQKLCKIILILNENEEGLEEYKKYFEKVIDFELELLPTAEECVNIVFNKENTVLKTEIIDCIKKAAIDLNISNIRILKKIERIINMINPYLKEYEIETVQIITRKLIFLAWCIYSHNANNVPPLEYIIHGYRENMVKNLIADSKKNYPKENLSQDEQKLKEKENEWNSIIHSYNFRFDEQDEFDSCLLKIIQKGYIYHDVEVQSILARKDENTLSLKARDKFDKTYNFYYYSFDNSTETIVQKIEEAFIENIAYLSVIELNNVVIFFKKLKKSSLAEAMIISFTVLNEKRLANIDMEGNKDIVEIDGDILKIFDSLYKKKLIPKPIKEMLERINKTQGWSQKDEIALAKATANDYYQTFKDNQENMEHLRLIKTAREFENRARNNNTNNIKPYNSVTEALERIAKENETNERIIRSIQK